MMLKQDWLNPFQGVIHETGLWLRQQIIARITTKKANETPKAAACGIQQEVEG